MAVLSLLSGDALFRSLRSTLATAGFSRSVFSAVSTPMGCPISLYKLGWLFVAAASAGPAFLPAAPTAHPRPWRRDSTSTRTTTISTITTTARTTTTASYVWTCGYLDGDIDEPRTAQAGYNCRIDTADSLWGFCPTSVRSASDCGLAAACQDSGSCSDVCQYNTNTALTTFTWYAMAGVCGLVLSLVSY